jgi:hypothetical protein
MGDSKIVVKFVRNCQSQISKIDDANSLFILQELQKFDEIGFFHILRGNNKKIDVLAKEASLVR